jgi:hypothetical protein
VLRFRCGTWSAALTVLFRNLRGRRAARGRALQQKGPGCCKVDAHQGFFSRVMDQRVTDKRRAAIIMRRLRPAVGHDPVARPPPAHSAKRNPARRAAPSRQRIKSTAEIFEREVRAPSSCGGCGQRSAMTPLRKLAFIKRQCQMAPTFCLGAWAMLVEFADFKQNCTASCKDEA